MSTATSSKYTVVFAVWGEGETNNVIDVSQRLSALLNTSPIVPINITTFGDPAQGVTKEFAAIVGKDGIARQYACVEGQTIDFSLPVGNPTTITVQNAVFGALAGGNPTNAQAFDVTQRLQQLINANPKNVPITIASFGDPSVGNGKHFGATVKRADGIKSFVCPEGTTVDFTQ